MPAKLKSKFNKKRSGVRYGMHNPFSDSDFEEYYGTKQVGKIVTDTDVEKTEEESTDYKLGTRIHNRIEKTPVESFTDTKVVIPCGICAKILGKNDESPGYNLRPRKNDPREKSQTSNATKSKVVNLRENGAKILHKKESIKKRYNLRPRRRLQLGKPHGDISTSSMVKKPGKNGATILKTKTRSKTYNRSKRTVNLKEKRNQQFANKKRGSKYSVRNTGERISKVQRNLKPGSGITRTEVAHSSRDEEDGHNLEPEASTSNDRPSRYLGRLNLKCPEDLDPTGSWIWGLVVTLDDKLIVTDYNNKAIKMVDIKRDRVISRLATEAHPRGITLINQQDLVAVTIPDGYRILLLGIIDRTLVTQRDIHTQEKCFGIVHHINTFIVSCIAPRRIQTLNMNGDVLRSFETFNNGQPLSVQPAFIALSLDNQSLYMSDSDNRSITQYSLDGELLRELAAQDFRGASGIAIDSIGDVYLATWASEKGCVYKLNSDLTNPRVVLDEKDGVLLPCPIYLNNDTYVLYLSNSLYKANDTVSMCYIESGSR